MLGAPVRAENNNDILSKADADAMFALSKDEWNANVLAAAAAGAAKAIPGSGNVLKMGTRQEVGLLVVAPSYDDSPGHPSFLQVSIFYERKISSLMTGDALNSIKQKASYELAPEYNVAMVREEMASGLLLMFFIRRR